MAAVVPTTQTQIIVAVQERKLYGIPIGKLQYLKTSFMDILWMYGTHMLLNPFDRLKTIKQTKMHLTSLNVPVSESAISNCLSLMRREGLSGLFKGTAAAFIGSVGRLAVQMHLYQSFRNQYFADGEYTYSGFEYWARRGIGAVLASLMTTLLVYPFEVAKTHMYVDLLGQNKKQEYPKLFRSMGYIRKNHGFPGIYRGLLGSLGTVPFQVFITMGVYEGMKSLMETNKSLPYPYDTASLPFLTAAVASVLCHPLDTIRRNWMITTLGVNTKTRDIKTVRNSLEAWKSKKGFCNPFHGISIALVRSAFMLLLASFKNSEIYRDLERIE